MAIAPRPWPHHEWDDDACCIHCGIDGCDVPRGSEMPPCTVHDENQRAKHRADSLTEADMLDQERGDW